MTRFINIALLFAMAALVSLTAMAASDAGDTHRQTVPFTKGKSSAQMRGSIKGSGDAEYTINAGAGQTLVVSLRTSNASNHFNIKPPGSKDAAMFIGSSSGTQAKLLVPADGSYVIQVYLMRNAARRNESVRFTMDVGITGKPLVPLAAAQDAPVSGTRFHAAANVPCQTSGGDVGAHCKAGVIRRGRDGTATIELVGANGQVRNVLFIKGQPVSSDSAQATTSSRQGDVVTVRIGDGERYDVPDALLTGG